MHIFKKLASVLIILMAIKICHASTELVEPVKACLINPTQSLTFNDRQRLARCLGWVNDPTSPCGGFYESLPVGLAADRDNIRLVADNASLYAGGRSTLQGHVEMLHNDQLANAQTAYVYRDATSRQVTRIELFGPLRFIELDKLMLAKSAVIDPVHHSGQIHDAWYRFNSNRGQAVLPAWGKAALIERFANEDTLLNKATYSTCPATKPAWQIEAKAIRFDHANATGSAKDAVLRVADVPVLYTPYFKFPTNHDRHSGFLMPIYGYTNLGGFDLGVPYYLNLAPNYDATLLPHVYTHRGVMMGGDVRLLTTKSAGIISGNFLPDDQAFSHFLSENQAQFPVLDGVSDNRWSFLLHESTQLSTNLVMNIDYQQVSDDYYLQDFSTNLALLTQNQLLRQGDVSYTSDHWLLRGMLQDYQTLHAVNQSMIADAYARLPQLMAAGSYDELPLNTNFNVLGQFDYFHWPSRYTHQPQGPRYHLNPTLSWPLIRSYGYVTPKLELVENHYDLSYVQVYGEQSFNRTIPRYSIDSGLLFERAGRGYTQTLEPRLYYLNVPYQNQSQIPAFDSAYMIFTNDQLFRDNRFSGFDRIGDANQLAYGVSTRWLSAASGREKASISLGQIRYFSKRRVNLCYSFNGECEDSQFALGYLSPVANTSPIASRANYQFNQVWHASANYVWDTATNASNNGDFHLHYQPTPDRLLTLGYSYLVSGNNLVVAQKKPAAGALNQATVAYAWPLTEQWSTLGVYSYNIGEGYDMMTFLGLQYNNCCWAMRLFGGRTFKSLAPDSFQPRYNNNVFIQVLLKGLGSVGTNDPGSILQSYLPGYTNLF